ncbi:GTPase IMAP family member 9-like [Hoplias malabaricus]|uniref:GTPase IMAP family member 9-like n=1 Tax=Hoplias malabaricus TaxID=27720 RepID=UPI0034635485
MENGSSPTAPDELRIVLLGEAGSGKTKVASLLLGREDIKEDREQCVLHDYKQAERKICLVDTPGWDTHSMQNIPDIIKNEIARSATLCPPGPHSVIVVLPVAELSEVPSPDELETLQQHVELLTEKVWKHTMVLFLCDGDVADTIVEKHVENARNILDKCGSEYFVLRNVGSETNIHALLKKIENEVGKSDDYPLPQSKPSKHEVTEAKRNTMTSIEESEERVALRQRRGSTQVLPPSLNEEQKAPGTPEIVEAIKQQTQDEFHIPPYLKPVTIILMSIFGALLGSVTGASYGTLGSAVGIVVGFFVSIPVSVCLIYAIKLAQTRTS